MQINVQFQILIEEIQIKVDHFDFCLINNWYLLVMYLMDKLVNFLFSYIF